MRRLPIPTLVFYLFGGTLLGIIVVFVTRVTFDLDQFFIILLLVFLSGDDGITNGFRITRLDLLVFAV